MLVFRKLVRLACIASIMALVFGAQAQTTWTITVSVPGGGGSVNINGANSPHTVNDNEGVTITAIANSGHKFVKYTNTATGDSIKQNPYTFAATQNLDLIAEFLDTTTNQGFTITLSSNPPQGGTTQKQNITSGDLAGQVNIRAIPNPPYIFVKWTNKADGSDLEFYSRIQNLTFLPTKNLELVANFAIQTSCNVSITAIPARGGKAAFDPPSSLNGGEDTIVPLNSPLKVVATANPGYRFVNWKNGPTVESTSEIYEFTPVEPSTILIANFEREGGNDNDVTVHLAANPPSGGTVAFDQFGGTDIYVPVGTSLTAVATPNEGYRFLNWSNGYSSLSTLESYTFSATGSLALTANFEGETSIVSVNDNSSIVVYPNPVSRQLQITNYELRITDYEICNILGEVLMQGKLNESSTINVESLANGMYYLKIGKTTIKFVKN